MVVALILSCVILAEGIMGIVWYDKLNNHTPFREVDVFDYLAAGLAAFLLTPFGAFCVVVCILSFIFK